MTIAVDFDGTIVEHKFPEIGKQKPFALDTLRALIADGHHVILWTVREGEALQEAVEYCRQRGVEFYAVNSEYPNSGWAESSSPRKLRADVYIDDSNLGGIPDWSEIYQMITHRQIHHHSSSHKRKKRNIFQRIVRRCREARSRMVR